MIVECEKIYFKLNTGRSKVDKFESRQVTDCRTILQDHKLEVVDHFKCLGSTIDEEGDMSEIR